MKKALDNKSITYVVQKPLTAFRGTYLRLDSHSFIIFLNLIFLFVTEVTLANVADNNTI